MLKDYFEVPNKPAIKSGNILSCDFTDHETFIPQPLDFTRNTLATYVDCNGVIKVSGVSDINLSPPEDFATDFSSNPSSGTAVNNPDGTITFANSTSSGANVELQNRNITTTKTYQIKFTISNYVQGTFRMSVGNQITPSLSANGTYVFYLTYTSGLNRNYFYTGNSTLTVSDISVKEVDLNLPRIDYLTEIGKAKELQKPSLLLEPQSTNKLTRSEEFSNSYWAKTNCTVQQSKITSPDGFQSSYKLIPDAGTGGNRSLARNFTGLSNFHTWSVFARAAEYKYAILRTRNNPNVVVSFDLENGTFNVNQSSAMYIADSAKIENYGNGWYRCSITLDPSQSTTVGQLYPSVSVGITGNEINNFDGDGVSGIYVFGAQFEERNYSTSYIPTSGSTVTRNQDTAKNAGSAPVFNSEEGTFYAEIQALHTNQSWAASQSRLGVSSGSNNNRATITLTSTNGINFVYKVGGVNSLSRTIAAGSIDLYKMNKFAFTWKTDEFKIWFNGVEYGPRDVSGSVCPANTFEKFAFDRNNDNSNIFKGRVKNIKTYRRVLTDSELTELTNNIT